MFPNTSNFRSTSVLGVWKHDETLVRVFDILLEAALQRILHTNLSPLALAHVGQRSNCVNLVMLLYLLFELNHQVMQDLTW